MSKKQDSGKLTLVIVLLVLAVGVVAYTLFFKGDGSSESDIARDLANVPKPPPDLEPVSPEVQNTLVQPTDLK